MKQLPSTFGTIVTINAKFLMACALGWVSWAVWPTTPEWWGLTIPASLFGIGAFAHVAGAFRLMVRVYHRDQALRAYLALGPEPKSSEMASDEQLQKAGMR